MLEYSRGDFEQTRDHWWWRPGWGPGARYFTFHLTFADSPELHEAATRFGDVLQGRVNVDVVPLPWLHLTMAGIGFTDHVESDVVLRTAETVFAQLPSLAIEPLRFDHLGLYGEGLSLHASRAVWLHRLREMQVAAIDSVCGIRHPVTAFKPHVTLAYFSGATDVDDLELAVRGVDVEPITVLRPQLSLLELGRDERVYTWRILASAALG